MAYAAVISVKQTIRKVLKVSDSNKELKSIQADLCSVQSILESVSLEGGNRDDAEHKQIADLASQLEDLIRSHTSDRSESSGDESSTLDSSPELVQVRQQLLNHANALKMQKCQQPSKDKDKGKGKGKDKDRVGDEGEQGEEDEQPMDSFVDPMRRNDEMVGLARERMQIQDWLLRNSPQLDVVSLVGRSGIGKSTLARKVCEDEHVYSKFWQTFFVVIGRRYELKEFLLFLVDQLEVDVAGIKQKDDKQIGVHLHQFLVGMKYLIVLDDVRSIEAWNKLRNVFQNDQRSGSRIIVTTTRQDVARNAGTNEYVLDVPLLNEHESWTLLKQMAFGTGETCPFHLEKFGKMIAKNCDGLPRVICFTADSLRRDTRAGYWSRAAEDTFLQSASRDDSTLLEAYNQLPLHLKECFLYMGVFPPSHEISTSKLLKLWAAEGLIRQEERNDKPLEETARGYLDDLVARNLVSVCEQSSRGRIKSCRIHFLDRNVCVDAAQREKFFCVISKYEDIFERELYSQSRLCILNNTVLALKDVHIAIKEYAQEARSLLFVGPQHQHWLPVCLTGRKLNVLDVLALRFHDFPQEVLKLVELKYLAITCDGDLPPLISKLENLQVLIVHSYLRVKFSAAPVCLPTDIWALRKLKHLDCVGFEMPEPNHDSPILEELLTLAGVSARSCTSRVFARIPKLLKLRMWAESTNDAARAFSFFHSSPATCPSLDSFKCNVMIQGPSPQAAFPVPAFPGAESLKKITLSRCRFSWEDMNNIGGLPNLEVLKLRCYAFCGAEWETKLGDFVKLKFLLLEDLDLERWALDEDYKNCKSGYESHFPELEHLIIRRCYGLVEIPGSIADIDTLEMIELDRCSPTATSFARELEEKRDELGNNVPQFRIQCAFLDEKNPPTQR